jgi:hypothetical protein
LTVRPAAYPSLASFRRPSPGRCPVTKTEEIARESDYS